MVPQPVSAEEMQLLQEFHVWRRSRFPVPGLFAGLKVAILAALFMLPACGSNDPTQRLDRRTLAKANTILDDLANTELAMSPETAGRLGLDQQPGLDTSRRLDDHSQAGFERQRLIRIDLLQQAQSRPVMPPDHPLAIDLAVAEDALARLVTLQAIGHGRFSLSGASPYAIDPFSGIWIEAPGLLVNDHRIDTPEDAQAYVSRLQALPDALDDTRRRLLADAESGVVLPAPLLAETRQRIDALRSAEPDQLSMLVETLTSLISGVPDIDRGTADTLIAAAHQSIDEDLRPAYARLSQALDELEQTAPQQIGMWSQPQGHEDYVALLTWYGVDAADLESLHQANVDAVLARTADLQAQLAARGVAPAPLIQELSAFDTLLSEEAAVAMATQPPVSPALPQPAIVLTNPDNVQRPLTPPTFTGFRELSARLDGQRPARTAEYVDQVALWPAYMRPGLQLQANILHSDPIAPIASPRRSTIRALIGYPAIEAGWRVYAADIYAPQLLPSPDAEIGLARLNLLNAAMAASDTGLHSKRWTGEQAITYLVETTGLPRDLMREAVFRIAANPGYYTARMVSYRRIKALNDRARAVLGIRYNERAFQTVLLQDGSRPLTFLEQDVDRWYEGLLAPSN